MTSITNTLKMTKSFFYLNPGAGYSDFEESLWLKNLERGTGVLKKKLSFLRYLLWKSLEDAMLIYSI
jgi:hypothetical protein